MLRSFLFFEGDAPSTLTQPQKSLISKFSNITYHFSFSKSIKKLRKPYNEVNVHYYAFYKGKNQADNLPNFCTRNACCAMNCYGKCKWDASSTRNLRNITGRFFLLKNTIVGVSPYIIAMNGTRMDHVFKNGPSKTYGRQPLKNLKGYGLL